VGTDSDRLWSTRTEVIQLRCIVYYDTHHYLHRSHFAKIVTAPVREMPQQQTAPTIVNNKWAAMSNTGSATPKDNE
jgi:hypothetical protein